MNVSGSPALNYRENLILLRMITELQLNGNGEDREQYPALSRTDDNKEQRS